MINNKDILYIKQGNRETIIYTIKKELIVTENINKIFDKWCLESLTTYKGRMEAIKRKYHLKKLVPIYINKDLMLFPINNKKSVDNIYINVINVLNICDMKDKSKIILKNQEYLIVNKKYQIVNNYYLRCLNIYDLI